MLQDIVAAGTTSYRGAVLRIIDSTDGTPETGVVYNTSGIDLWYRKVGAARTAITEATLAAVDSAYSSGGFIHISDGYYRLDLPDAALDTEGYVDFGGTVTGMVVIGGRVKVASATRGLSGTALPNAAAEAAGGLYTRGTGAGQIAQDANGNLRANVDTIKTQAVTCGAGVTVGAYVGNASALQATDANGRVQVQVGTGAGQINSSSGKVPATVAAADVSGNPAVTLANGAHGGAAATMQLGGAGGLTATHTGNTTGSVGSVTGAVGSVTAGVTLAASAIQAIWDALTSALTTAGSIGKRIVDYLTGDIFARLGAPAEASTAADIAAVKALLVGLALTTGSVATDAGNSASQIKTALSETANDHWKDCLVLLTSGALAGQCKRIGAYNGTTKILTLVSTEAFTGTPADNVTFAIINR